MELAMALRGEEGISQVEHRPTCWDHKAATRGETWVPLPRGCREPWRHGGRADLERGEGRRENERHSQRVRHTEPEKRHSQRETERKRQGEEKQRTRKLQDKER